MDIWLWMMFLYQIRQSEWNAFNVWIFKSFHDCSITLLEIFICCLFAYVMKNGILLKQKTYWISIHWFVTSMCRHFLYMLLILWIPVKSCGMRERDIIENFVITFIFMVISYAWVEFFHGIWFKEIRLFYAPHAIDELVNPLEKSHCWWWWHARACSKCNWSCSAIALFDFWWWSEMKWNLLHVCSYAQLMEQHQ